MLIEVIAYSTLAFGAFYLFSFCFCFCFLIFGVSRPSHPRLTSVLGIFFSSPHLFLSALPLPLPVSLPLFSDLSICPSSRSVAISSLAQWCAYTLSRRHGFTTSTAYLLPLLLSTTLHFHESVNSVFMATFVSDKSIVRSCLSASYVNGSAASDASMVAAEGSVATPSTDTVATVERAAPL